MENIASIFDRVLRKAAELKASDVHLKAGSPFRLRAQGRIVTLNDTEILKPEDTAILAAKILIAAKKATEENITQRIRQLTDEDCSYSLGDVNRYRVNICSQRGSLALVLRAIPFKIPTFEELALPPVLEQIALEERGMVLVTGVTGSGKSTTLAAIIDYINHKKGGKVVTIEDPIEYLYRDDKASIIQREVGSDTESFAKALRAALRQDPDVIMVGEMRDRETIEIAVKAAETGHLVLSTLHTTDAPKTIMRVIGSFDLKEERIVRTRLAESLKAIVSQRLLPKKDGTSRVAALEIMRTTFAIKDYIENPEKTGLIKDMIEKGRDPYGMQTFDQHLRELYNNGDLSFDVARAAATSPDDFERNTLVG